MTDLWYQMRRVVQTFVIFALASAAVARGDEVAERIRTATTARGVVSEEVFRRMVRDRAVMTYATLEDLPPVPPQTRNPEKEYRFYGSTVIRAPQSFTEKTVTDYTLYPEMISYIEEISQNPQTQLVKVVGGIWNWKLVSFVRFYRQSVARTSFEVVAGHFRGMRGDFFFDDLGSRGTLVLCRGSLRGTRWPPRFVIERGAEIVLDYVASKMRSYTEMQKRARPAQSSLPAAAGVPQPRRSLRR